MINVKSRSSKGKEYLGIEIGTTLLKISHIKVFSPDKGEVLNLSHRAITGLSDADVSKAIMACINELKVARATPVVDVIPSHLAITKNIEVPSINSKEIKEIINLQAGRHTPYAREEVIVDYIEIGTYKRNYTKILLVIVTRSLVKRHFEILNNAGLRLENVVFASEGISRFVAKSLKLENETIPVSTLHIDETVTDFSIMVKSKVAFVRSIPIGAQQLLGDKEKSQSKFAEELKKSLEAYQNENIEQNPNQLIVTGAIQELGDLETVLKETLRLPVRNMAYFKSIAFLPAALKLSSPVQHISFFTIIATVVSRDSLKTDLVPEEIKLRRAIEEKGKDLLKTSIFLLASLVLAFSILMSKIYFKSIYLNELSQKYEVVSGEAKKIEQIVLRNNLIRNFLSSRGYSLEVLSELYNVTPLELEFNDIRYEDQGRLTVKGTADSMAAVFTLVDNMEKSRYFNEVKTRYTTKRKEGKKDVTDFEITCMLNSGVKR